MMIYVLYNKSKKGHKHTKSLYISIKSKSNDYQNKNKNMVHRTKILYTRVRYLVPTDVKSNGRTYKKPTADNSKLLWAFYAQVDQIILEITK